MNENNDMRKKPLSEEFEPVVDCDAGFHESDINCVTHINGSYFAIWQCRHCGVEEERMITSDQYDALEVNIPVC